VGVGVAAVVVAVVVVAVAVATRALQELGPASRASASGVVSKATGSGTALNPRASSSRVASSSMAQA
jgi:hypothetical protein